MGLSRERIYRVINGEPVDGVVTGELIVAEEVVAGVYGVERPGFAEKFAFVQRLGLDIVTVSPEGKRDLSFFEPVYPDLEKWTATSLFVFALLPGPFGQSMEVVGFRELVRGLSKGDVEVLSLIEKVVKTNCRVIEQLADQGVNGVIVADDVAFTRGLYFRPELMRCYFLPAYQQMAAKAGERKLVVFFHSDGDYRELLPDLMTAGFDGIHCLDERAGMKLEEIRKETAGKLCLWGHLTPEKVAKLRDESELEKAWEEAKSYAARGRFILGTTTGIYKGLDWEGLIRLYRREKGNEQ